MKFEDIILQEQKNIDFDKIYTNPKIAKFCISKLNLGSYDRIIEPSAGSGAFSSQIKNCEAYDLKPEDSSIKKQDFLKFQANKGNILVIGNPPFGKSNALSLAFINHAATFAKTIAFVLPKSCQKETFINRLDKHVFLRRVVELPKNSFLIKGVTPCDINCNFFIFDVKDNIERKLPEKPVTNDFSFTRNKEDCDFAILRKGWKVGRLFDKENNTIADSSKYYIKSNINVKVLQNRLSNLKYPEAGLVLGSDSISQREIIRAYNKVYGKLHQSQGNA